MRVAAIVVAYNSARELPESLGCLAALPLARIVVADNSSTDDSAEVAARYTPHVQAMPNAGFGASINVAAGTAPDVDAYFLLNPDCRLSGPDFAALVDALDDDQRLGAVAPQMRYPNGRYGISSGPEPSIAKEWLAALRADHLVPGRLKSFLARSALLRSKVPMLGYLAVGPTPETRPAAWVSGFCMLVRAEAFRDVGGFDPDFFLYFEDVDICRRLRGRGWQVASVGTSVADHKESTSTAAVGKRRLYRSGMNVYFSKHGTWRQRLLARALGRLPI
ncbi:glycosyltransferase family 2 protein [Micromonospora sp. NBC_01796]|uniref:glycosyltransferase family 2 protein n=1 Tax=Micromonospora sp. NBC_01796 TaxID=2975987 RepID=UPI002DD9A050|nr:glycosyltransferase family 2 protein [Micromonospora sp. NBC_01796]WSA85055.1 glycosyltransferase family 2 protein [Micromonospora sp. NBC_01796]